MLYFGLGKPSQNLVLADSALHAEALGEPPSFDPDRANALLDEVGLTERDGNGVRLMADGRPLQIIVETAGEEAIQIDALELIRDTWRELGIDMYPRPSQRDVLRNRAFSGDLAMSVWYGYDNGIPSPAMPPDERVPASTMFLTGPAWGAYAMSGGESGQAPDFEPAQRLMELYQAWLDTKTDEERAAAWGEILKVHADEVLTLGTVEGVVQPVVVTNTLKNVPEKAIYGWDPGGQFGIYRPDEFYFEPAE